MSTDSTFDNTRPPTSGQVQGGLDRFLSPTGRDRSSMPPALADGKANEDERQPVDCDGADSDQAVCDLAKAVEEQQRRTP